MRSAILIKVVFVTVGVSLLAASHSFYKSEREFVRKSSTVTGKVVDNLECSGRKKRRTTLFCPVIEFQPKANVTVTFTHHLGRKPEEFEIGDTVSVIYIDKSPYEAKIDGFFAKWGVTFGLTLMGFVFTFIGSLVAIWDYKYQKKSAR